MVVTHHGGLRFAGQAASGRLVERAGAGRAGAAAVRGRVGARVAGDGRLPT